MVKIMHREVSPFLSNCYLVIDESSREAALVDPGDEPDLIERFVKDAGARVRYLMATHGHVDHVGAAAETARRLGLGFMLNRKDAFLLDALPETAARFGLGPVEIPEIAQGLEHGDALPLGDTVLEILEAPGHSPGSVLIKAGREDLLSGDVLFAGSVGRTDLPGGDGAVLARSIREVLLPLGDEVRVYPGHGPATTIGWERRSNPFVQAWAAGEDRA